MVPAAATPPAFDRPRLLQRPLRRHHAGADQRRVDLRVGVGLAAVLDPDHRGQDGPQAGVVVQVEWLVDTEAARLGDAPGVRLGVVLVGRRPHLHQFADGVEAATVVVRDQQHRRGAQAPDLLARMDAKPYQVKYDRIEFARAISGQSSR